MSKENLEIRECFVSEKTNIVQSNYLIERKQKLSLPATQLMFTLTGMINRDDEDFKEYKISVRKFAELWDSDENKAYEMVAKALEELRTKGINNHSVNPETGKRVFETIGFISYGRYEQGEGYATMTIEPRLKEHYIDLKNNFTKYTFGNLLKLQAADAQVNTIRTYELLKQYETVGVRTMSIREYKDFLGLIVYEDNKQKRIKKEKYKGSNANLKTKVLEPAREKINECTDICIDYYIDGRGLSAKIFFVIVKNAFNFSSTIIAKAYELLKNTEGMLFLDKKEFIKTVHYKHDYKCSKEELQDMLSAVAKEISEKTNKSVVYEITAGEKIIFNTKTQESVQVTKDDSTNIFTNKYFATIDDDGATTYSPFNKEVLEDLNGEILLYDIFFPDKEEKIAYFVPYIEVDCTEIKKELGIKEGQEIDGQISFAELEEMDPTAKRLLEVIPEECKSKLPQIRQLVVDCLKGGNKVIFNKEERDNIYCEILHKFNAIYKTAQAEGLINKSAGGWYVKVLEAHIEQGKFNMIINEPKSDEEKDVSFDVKAAERKAKENRKDFGTKKNTPRHNKS